MQEVLADSAAPQIEIMSLPFLQRVTSYGWVRDCIRIAAGAKRNELEQPLSQSRKPLALGALLVLAVAIAANGTTARLSVKSEVDGDGPFYVGIARNLAAGRGYMLSYFGVDKPTMGRAPVWPAMLSVPAWFAPGVDDSTLIRVTAACLNVANALLLFGIAWMLSRNHRISTAAGVGYALYPVALAITAGGFSEVPYVFVAALGTLLILRGGWALYPGALILGLSALVRSNFILLPVMAGLAALFMFGIRRAPWRFVAAAALFWLPAGLWIVRNYALSGEFPILSTIEGETLYGANNDYVNSNLAVWGYWVFPNQIPGETAKRDLAATMTERQVDRYYHRKAITFLKQNWFGLPRLELGKLIRGFVPVPWVPKWGSYCVFLFRAALYVAILLNLRTLRSMEPVFRILVTGMFLVVLATSLIYYGTYRFTFCVEVFLLPVVVIGIFRQVETWGKAVLGSVPAVAEQ
jgi:hypothetical protein